MRVGSLFVATLVAVFLFMASTALAANATTPTRYYLALGDSLSVGFQPNSNGTGVETDRGYTNDLWTLESRRIKRLRLVQLGCPGDTTTSLLTGRGNDQSAQQFHCPRTGGSQLTAAVRFLKRHHKAGQVPLITIDIGANDVDVCASAGSLAAVATCVTNGENTITQNTPTILKRLKAAAPKGTRFVAMNLYDPVLGDYFSANPSDKILATASVSFLQTINGSIQTANTQSGFRTADVADAFQSYNNSPTFSYQGQPIPVNVAYVCGWTWACTTPPVGPNIHANDNGYSVIARVFYRAIGRLR